MFGFMHQDSSGPAYSFDNEAHELFRQVVQSCLVLERLSLSRYCRGHVGTVCLPVAVSFFLSF